MSKSERADDLFILETLRHVKAELWRLYDYENLVGTDKDPLLADIRRSIKILEGRK